MKKDKIITLKNGLKIIFYQDKTKHSKYAELIVNYGAINSSFSVLNKSYHMNDGIAHFIEHLLIEHSIYGNIGEYFTDNYTSFNSFTSTYFTKFYINTAIDFEKKLIMLIKMANVPNFTKEDIETTKKAIYEEIRISNDNNFDSLNKIKNKCLFHHTMYSSILGNMDDINKINYDDIKLCYSSFYKLNNQVLVVAGNFNIKRITKLINKISSNFNNTNNDISLFNYNEPNTVAIKEKSIYKDVNKEFISLNYKINVSNLNSYEKVKLTYYLHYFLSYNYNESSNIYKELVDKHLIIDNITYSYSFIDKFLIIEIGTYTSKIKEFIDLIDMSIHKKEFNINDFNIKKSNSIIELIMRSDNLIDMVKPFIDNVITFNYNCIDKVEDIQNFTYDDYKTMINNLDFSNYCILKILKDKS